MTSDSSLTSNFTITTNLNVRVAFQNDDGDANHGGLITIFTPSSAGQVATALRDSSGNFTIYLVENPSLSCMINLKSTSETRTPYVTVAKQSGLTCSITGPQQTEENTYDYTLCVGLSSDADNATHKMIGTTAIQHVATMTLPAGGMASWTQIMQSTVPIPNAIGNGSPIVMAWACFDDGTKVVGGVYKSARPADYNVKFMWVLDANGNQYPDWPLDVSDDEDFLAKGYAFSLTADDEEPHYLLHIVEKHQ